MERLVVAVPGFRESWENFLKEWRAEASPPWYLGMSELAHYVVENYAQGTTSEFPDLFATVEVLLDNPDPELVNLITVGLLEDIQNIASHRDFGPVVFRRWLGPRSLALWDKVDVNIQKVAAWAEQRKPRWWQFWRRRAFDSERALAHVENPELRKIIESTYRKPR